MSHAVIVCEGYQDRAFISEWLDRRGMKKVPKPTLHFVGTYEKTNDSGSRVSIVPAMGRTEVVKRLKQFADQVSNWLVVVDTDGASLAEARSRLDASIRASVPFAEKVAMAFWEPVLEGVIERGLRSVYPQRMPEIDAFVANRRECGATTGKETAHVYCAGWESDSFGESFYGQVLRDALLRPVIERELAAFASEVDRLLAS